MSEAQGKEKRLVLISGYCRSESNDMNIIDGIIMIIFEYQRFAKWSKEFKGSLISLKEDDAKAICNDDYGNSVRGDIPICRSEIVSWEFQHMVTVRNCNFIGVVSSQQTDFSLNPFDRQWYNAWGVDDSKDRGYIGTQKFRKLAWKKPAFPIGIEFNLKVIADWTQRRCKLTLFYEGKKLNDNIEGYTMLLPTLDDDFVWYPCVTLYNKDAYSIIRYV